MLGPAQEQDVFFLHNLIKAYIIMIGDNIFNYFACNSLNMYFFK